MSERDQDQGKCYGCLFCKTGSENSIARLLEKEFPEIEVRVPRKKRIRRTATGALEEEVALFPGYIFFLADGAFHAYNLPKHDDVYRLLMTDEDDWHLRGSDLALVSMFFENDGVIGLSKAYYEGDRIRILDGFMKNYEGQIIRVNRRHKTAEICLTLGGKTIMMWLGFELIEDVSK